MEGGSRRFSQSDRLDNDEDPSQSSSSRTYIDIIREEDESGTAYRDLVSSKSGNKSRQSFNDRLGLSRSSSSVARSSSSRPIPASDISFGSRRRNPSSAYPGDDCVVDCDGDVCIRSSRLQTSFRHPSGRVIVEEPDDQDSEDASNSSYTDLNSRSRFSRSSSVAVSRAANEEAPAPAPVKISLMDLLEETDRQAGVVGSAFFGIGGDDEDEDEEVEDDEGGEEHVCCVCMVRHRGMAFVQCGHTFCRLCSRELWVSRGNCPLCNGYIMEILHIF